MTRYVQEKVGEIHRIRSKTFSEKFREFIGNVIATIFLFLIVVFVIALFAGNSKADTKKKVNYYPQIKTYSI